MNAKSLRSRRFVAPGIHLLVSVGVALITSFVVFKVWYPPPYAEIAAGTTLFLLFLLVDVVLGPALTLVVADPAKSMNALRRDLVVIVAVQFAGLAYGTYALALARPVYLAFEVDRLRVVTAADIDPATLEEALPHLRTLPWSGPRLIAAVRPTRPDEVLRSIELALAGFDISLIPRNWQDYAAQRDVAWSVAQPVSSLRTRYPEADSSIAQIAAETGQSPDSLRFLPVESRRESWIALISAPDARIVGYLPLDGFF